MQLSVVLLTWNEERNIEAALGALARQRDLDFEVIVVDAASTDGTAMAVRRMQQRFPVPLRLDVAATRIPIGEARNRGVELARADAILFLSADAEPDPDWTAEAKRSLARADMVFGPQTHDPKAWTVAACVRGLRYHFPDTVTDDPLRYASNVAAAYRKEILVAFPFDPWANAAEDLLLAQRAQRAGYVAEYNPGMRVRHHDVQAWREEWSKAVREGRGCGVYADELGLQTPVLVWGILVAGCAAMSFVAPLPGLPLLAAVLWLPAVRRAIKRRAKMPLAALLKGVAASPAFDVAFVVQYVRGLLARRPAPTESAARPLEETLQ